MKETVRFGLVGCGAVAPWHLEAIEKTEHAALCAVTDADAAAGSALARRLGVPFFPDLPALLRGAGADAVCLCTPSGTHAALAETALRAGVHAVVEKPLAVTPASLEALLSAERESPASLFPISQMRFLPDVRRARTLIEGGALGRVVLADLSMKYYREPDYYASRRWRGTWAQDGGGALMNQGIHGVDLLCFLCGAPDRIAARAGTLCHAIEAEDTLAASFELPGGGLGVLTASTAAYPGARRRLEICGTEGSLTLEEGVLTSLRTRSGRDFSRENAAIPSGSGDPAGIGTEPHRAQYETVVASIRSGAAPALSAGEAAVTLRTIWALYRAAGIGAEKAI